MNNTDIFKRLYNQYTSRFIIKIIFAALLSVLVAISTSATAWLLDPAIEKIFINKDQTLIVLIPFAIILAFTTKGISLYFAKLIMINVGEEVKKIIQIDMLNSFIKADTETIENKHSGNYISNLNFDVQQITRMLSEAFLSLFKDGLTLMGLLIVMFYQNWKLSLIAIIMIPLATFAAKSLGKRISKVSNEQMIKAGKLNTYLIEIFKNHKLAKIFQMEKYEQDRANNKINQLKETSRKINVVYVRASPIMEFLTGIMIAFLIFYSAKLVSNNEIDISNFFSFLAAMMLAYQPVRSLATLNISVQQGIAGAKRVLPIIDDVPKIINKLEAKDLNVNKAKIEFNNVNFRYDNTENNILNSINLVMSGGNVTALVGHSGAGKSTILNLIPRFYNINSGDIKIDNQSIYEVKIESLRKHISLVSQETTLFDDTIKKNIAYAKTDASDEEIKQASRYSFCNEFIEKLPDGYDTIIGESGIRLSGGEKQRLSIARAMLKQSPIILLDEATSSLDAETESKIQKAINFLIKGRTTIVIAHRLSTILNADKIYVIEGGNLVGEGKHEELLISSKQYKNFYDKQIHKS